MDRTKPTLADVDGTIPGKVQLMSVKLVDGIDEDPQPMCTYFEENDRVEDPWLFAEGLKRGIEDDWPDHYWAIVGNWRATYLVWRRNMRQMGFLGEEGCTPEAYVDLHWKK